MDHSALHSEGGPKPANSVLTALGLGSPEAGRRAARQKLLRLIKQRRQTAQKIDRMTARIADFEARALAAIDDGDEVRSAEAAHAIVFLERERKSQQRMLDRLERAIAWLKRGVGGEKYEIRSGYWKHGNTGVADSKLVHDAVDVMKRLVATQNDGMDLPIENEAYYRDISRYI